MTKPPKHLSSSYLLYNFPCGLKGYRPTDFYGTQAFQTLELLSEKISFPHPPSSHNDPCGIIQQHQFLFVRPNLDTAAAGWKFRQCMALFDSRSPRCFGCIFILTVSTVNWTHVFPFLIMSYVYPNNLMLTSLSASLSHSKTKIEMVFPHWNIPWPQNIAQRVRLLHKRGAEMGKGPPCWLACVSHFPPPGSWTDSCHVCGQTAVWKNGRFLLRCG